MSSTADPRPRPAELLPHRPPMLLLDRVLDRPPGAITCAARVRADCPLVDAHGLPSWALPELVAQAAAALRGLTGGDPARPGFLAALPEVRLAGPGHLPVGAALEVSARRQGIPRSGMALLEGEVRWQGRVVCRARLVVTEDVQARRGGPPGATAPRSPPSGPRG